MPSLMRNSGNTMNSMHSWSRDNGQKTSPLVFHCTMMEKNLVSVQLHSTLIDQNSFLKYLMENSTFYVLPGGSSPTAPAAG